MRYFNIIIILTISLIFSQNKLTAQCPNPTQSGIAAYCGPGTYSLTAMTLGNNLAHRWYTSASGGYPIDGPVNVDVGGYPTISTYTAYFTANTTYYVSTYNPSTGCESSRVPVLVTINTPVAPYVNITCNPSITGSDANGPYLNVCTGTSVTFTASSSYSGTYTWLVNDVPNGVTGTTFTSSNLSNNARVSVKLSGIGGCVSTSTVYSSKIRMNIIPTVGTPTAISVASGIQPTCQLTNSGLTTSYSTTASNNTGFNWSIDNPSAGSINSSTGKMTWANGFYGSVNIKVSARGCNGPSAQVVRAVNINQNLPVSIAISGQTNLCEGTNPVFTASVINGGSNPQYIWKVNGNPTSNRDPNSPDFIYATTSPLNNGDMVTCQLTSNATCAINNPAISNQKIIVTQPKANPYVNITSNLNTSGYDNGLYLNICSGTSLTFTASSTFSGTYTWLVNDVPNGVTGTTFTTSNFSNNDRVSVKLSGIGGCVTTPTVNSVSIRIAIDNIYPVVRISTGSSMPLGTQSTATLNCELSNAGTAPNYQWKLNGNNIPGGNLASYTSANWINGSKLTCTVTRFEGCSTKSADFLIAANPLFNQNDKNFVISYTLLDSGITSQDAIYELNTDKVQKSIAFVDGLGRPIQNIQYKASPSGKDIIQPIVYDGFGREVVKYMPHTTANNNGLFQADALAKNKAFYDGLFDDTIFTAVTVFEPSPLNRPLQQGAPGNDWQIGSGHEIHFGYGTNAPNNVKKWTIAEPGTKASNYTEDDTYDAATLFVDTVYDENNKPSKEYKNLQGQVVLKEDAIGGRTYYIYDDFGLLRCVVPPKAGETVDDLHCYFYRYDHRKRMVTKKIPGADSVVMIYDKRDRLVLSQDGNMRANNNWMATLYDKFNRPIETAIYNYNGTQASLKSAVDNNIDYLKTINNLDIQSKTHYDDYTGLDTSYHFIKGYYQSYNSKIKGQIAYTKTYFTDGDKDSLITVNYYDNKYRVIQTIADNHLGGKDIISNQYDFVGKIIETTQKHKIAGKDTVLIVKHFDYDHAGRLLETKMKLDNANLKTISKNQYNELGQLQRKKVMNAAGADTLYTTAYNYNIRGWMTKMSYNKSATDTLFRLSLGYNTGNFPQYNGNIALMGWKSQRYGSNYYNFEYDNINRLKKANYNGQETGNYSTSYDYDLNGNILHLKRRGKTGSTYGPIDQLTYFYNGNQLIGVNDLPGTSFSQNGFKDANTSHTPNISDPASIEYEYDVNGNLTTDVNKDIDIAYNHLNLPVSVDNDTGRIEYLYDAAGIKLRQTFYKGSSHSLDKITDYIGNFIYETKPSEINLKTILTDEGRLVPKAGGGFDYEYFIKDHLGNTRLTVQDSSGLAAVKQENHYYPFGMVLGGQSYQANTGYTKNDYLYNGKEMQDELGLDWYDYGARFYDPALGRFFTVDPHAEFYIDWTPYNYVANNPILMIDPNGMDWYTNRFTGEQKWFEGSGWKLFWSRNMDGLYTLPEVVITGTSPETMQEMREDYVSNYNFEQRCNQAGIETYRTDNRLEAVGSQLNLVALPQVFSAFSNLGKISNIFKSSTRLWAEEILKSAKINEVSGTTNCLQVAENADILLRTGQSLPASNIAPQSFKALATRLGVSLKPVKEFGDILKVLKAQGEGATVIINAKNFGKIGHNVNATVKNGKVVILDFQKGIIRTADNMVKKWKYFEYINTTGL